MHYLINTPIGYVAGFNSNAVVVTPQEYVAVYAKKFATRKSAERFINNYADIGYGLRRVDAIIEEVA